MPAQPQSPEADHSSAPASRNVARQLLKLAGPYWNCERRHRVRGATLALLLLTVGQVGLTVWGN